MAQTQNNALYDQTVTQNRELSWLRFDERVLEEAGDETVPLLERLKFLSIFTTNLDEFFMVRVGSLYDLSLIKKPGTDNKTGMTPAEQLQSIYRALPRLYALRDQRLTALEEKLKDYGVARLEWKDLAKDEQKKLQTVFRQQVLPLLSPLVINPRHPFPHLINKNLVVAVVLRTQDKKEEMGIIPIPTSLPPYYCVDETRLRFVMTEELILRNASLIFPHYTIQQRCVLTVTRNADLDPDEELDDEQEKQDFRQHMKKVLKKRGRLSPVRLEAQGELAPALMTFFCSKLNLRPDQVFTCRSPLDLHYLFPLIDTIPIPVRRALSYEPFTPHWPAFLDPSESLIRQVQRQDVLLSFPYESADPFIQLLKEAANDRAVTSIRITIYRLASQSKIAEQLCAAAENGKEVSVLMELRARFDENNNIGWAERLEEAGCTVIYGMEGYKVHSKICVITRYERGKPMTITQIGTGNYNEKTATLYTDLHLITADPGIGADATTFFHDLMTSNLAGQYERLLVAPHSMLPSLLAFIDGEIDKVRAGGEGHIFLKLNSLTERAIIDRLVAASQAGVQVQLIVRGICCLLPGIPDKTDNIQVISIVGRFLEHSRIYSFGVGEEQRLYLSSADCMTRNLLHRVEVACPILDPAIRERVNRLIRVLWQDNAKGRLLDSEGLYQRRRCGEDEKAFNSQEYLIQSEPFSPPPRPQKKTLRGLWDQLRNR